MNEDQTLFRDRISGVDNGDGEDDEEEEEEEEEEERKKDNEAVCPTRGVVILPVAVNMPGDCASATEA
jgi:hypothetical protein